MKGIANSFGVAACGLATSILTALVVVVVARMTGFNLFSLTIWFVIPFGAIFVGLFAASGYYFGSLYFHKRTGWLLLFQMIVIAGLTQFLIYYMGYTTLVLDDGRRVADFVPFGRYLDTMLTSAHYRSVRSRADSGEVGSFGYWLAAFQFVGLLVGGIAVYIFLWTKPVCKTCNMYLRPLSERQKLFPDSASASLYYDTLFQHPVDSPEFAALIRSEAKAERQKGALLITTALKGCPKCKSQLIDEKIHVHNGETWSDVTDLNRQVILPQGVNLLGIFRT